MLGTLLLGVAGTFTEKSAGGAAAGVEGANADGALCDTGCGGAANAEAGALVRRRLERAEEGAAVLLVLPVDETAG